MKTPRLSDEHDHNEVVDMVMSDEDLGTLLLLYFVPGKMQNF